MRHTWTNTEVETELRTYAAKLGRLPTVREMRDDGRNDLMCAITRSGGLLNWATRLGIQRDTSSDSDFGWRGEKAVASILETNGFSVVRSGGVKAPYDLLVDGALRLDVKSASRASYPGSTGPCSGWFYRIGKIPSCDLLALYQADTGAIYFIPWNACPRSNITITENGKYSQYRNRFDIIRRHLDAMAALRKTA